MQVSSSVVGAVGDAYTTKAQWPREIDHALVVDCLDPRLPEARDEFLRHLGLTNRYDPFFVPGGPALFTLSSPYCFVDQERLRFIHGLHVFRRVIGIAHFDCAYYKTNYPDASKEDRRSQQVADLREFMSEMKRLVPGANIELYYVGPNDEGLIEYQRVL